MKSTYMQVGKFPIIISYCFVLGGGSKLVMLICPYPGGGTYVASKTTTSKVHPTSHLFVCCVESFQLPYALSTMKPLKLGFIKPKMNITSFSFFHMTH
jgi:hypothetical protein